MHLMYTIGPDGRRIYTLKKIVDGVVAKSAHPARFSPDDKYSRHRVTLKKRYGLLLTQQNGTASQYPHGILGAIGEAKAQVRHDRQAITEQEMKPARKDECSGEGVATQRDQPAPETMREAENEMTREPDANIDVEDEPKPLGS